MSKSPSFKAINPTNPVQGPLRSEATTDTQGGMNPFYRDTGKVTAPVLGFKKLAIPKGKI